MKFLKKLLLGFIVFCAIMFVIALLIIKKEGGDFATFFETTTSLTQQATDIGQPNSEPATIESPEEKTTVQNEYMNLTENKQEYLLFLKVIGLCYKNNTLTNEMFDEMAEHSRVQALVEDMMTYRYKNGKLSPDFQKSFSDFWNDDMTQNETETVDALENSFEISYDFITKTWKIKENGATAAFHAVYNVNGEDYKDFEGRLDVGDIIYLRDENHMISYFEVRDFGENKKNNDGTVIKNAIYVKELYSVLGEDLTSYWRDLDDMIEHNRETREETGYPVYYVKE